MWLSSIQWKSKCSSKSSRTISFPSLNKCQEDLMQLLMYSFVLMWNLMQSYIFFFNCLSSLFLSYIGRHVFSLSSQNLIFFFILKVVQKMTKSAGAITLTQVSRAKHKKGIARSFRNRVHARKARVTWLFQYAYPNLTRAKSNVIFFNQAHL